jgi:hypothetical protein
MVFTNLTPFTPAMSPITNISPLTYRDASTFLEYLETIKEFINETLVPDSNTMIANAIAEYQSAKDSWDANYLEIMDNLAAQIAVLNEQAVTGLINAGTAHTAIVALIDSAIAAVHSTIGTETDTKIAALDDDVTSRLAGVSTDIANVNTALGNRIGTVETGIANTDYGYLVTAFTGNGGFHERLSVFYSPDGKTVFGGGANQVYADPNTGNSLRDPSTIKIGDTWYTAYTINNGYSKNFGVIKSTDLINWSPVTTVDVSSIGGLNQAWAPELVKDTNGDIYVFFSSMNASSVGSTYYVKATTGNLTAWGAPSPVLWTNAPSSIIDPTFVKSGNTWFCFFKNEDTKYIERATSTSLTGTWTVDRTGNWSGWGSGLEGPEIVKTRAGMWRLYLDRYSTNSGYMYTESSDLGTWTALTAISVGPNVLPASQRVRHGSFVRLTDQQSATVAMSAALSKPRRHGEFSGTGNVSANNPNAGPGTLVPFSDSTYSSGTASFITIPAAHQLKLEIAGVYSVSWVGQHAGVAAGTTAEGNAFMAIKSPDQTATYATVDILPTSGEASVSFPKKYFEAGTVLQFFCQFGNAMNPLYSHIVVDKE